ncbi:MAG: HAD family hydrolase [Eubacteriales bacterium]|nr:HAD family hydrolase [Eubacteriales bacterium]
MDSIIFDVDGTLWDCTGILADAWTRYLKEKEHIDLVITQDRLQSLFGQLLPEIARQLFPALPPQEQQTLIDRLCQVEEQVLKVTGAPLYGGMEETLRELSKKVPLFIVSNCQAGYIELFLEKTGLGPLFQDHLCPGDTGEAKAENIMTIVKRHHLSAPVYVGDTDGDWNACQKAGVPFVFASYGFGQVAEPDHVIDRPADILSLL